MKDLDQLVCQAVDDAQVAYREGIGRLEHPRALVNQTNGIRPKGRPWTQAENDFYRANIGRLSYEEIAERLGRSLNAIKCHFTRAGLPAASKVNGWITAQKIAELMSLDPHKITRWIDLGILPGERLPFFQGRIIRRTSWIRLKIWLTRPENWIYFDTRLIKKQALQHLVLRAQERWGDEWWTTRQAADYLGCDDKDIQRSIKLGRNRGIQAIHKGGRNQGGWAFWYVRKSEAMHLRIPRGKSNNGIKNWSAGADRFLLEARTRGWEWEVVARMMRWSSRRCQYRYQQLNGKEMGNEKESGEIGN